MKLGKFIRIMELLHINKEIVNCLFIWVANCRKGDVKEYIEFIYLYLNPTIWGMIVKVLNLEEYLHPRNDHSLSGVITIKFSYTTFIFKSFLTLLSYRFFIPTNSQLTISLSSLLGSSPTHLTLRRIIRIHHPFCQT